MSHTIPVVADPAMDSALAMAYQAHAVCRRAGIVLAVAVLAGLRCHSD
jgi:hypothetical protein